MRIGDLIPGAGEDWFGAARFDKVRLGTGVVGKLTNVTLAVIFLLCLIAYSLKGGGSVDLMILAGMGIAVFVVYLVASLWFATKNPALAALEGSELIAYRKLEMASKDTGVVVEQANTLPPADLQRKDQ